jgi:hypothetical protein
MRGKVGFDLRFQLRVEGACDGQEGLAFLRGVSQGGMEYIFDLLPTFTRHRAGAFIDFAVNRLEADGQLSAQFAV